MVMEQHSHPRMREMQWEKEEKTMVSMEKMESPVHLH